MPVYEPPARSSGLDDLERRLRGPVIDEGSAGAQMAASVVLPGAATVRRTPWLGVVLLLVGVGLPVALGAWAVVRRSDPVGLTLDRRFLTAIAVVLPAFVVSRLAAVAEVAVAFRRTTGIGGKTAVAVLAVSALGAPMVWTAIRVEQARGVVDHVFARDDGVPIYRPNDGGSGVDPASLTTILVIGAGAGGTSGRDALGADTITLVTVDRASGRTAVVSIPEDLSRLAFPPGSPLDDRFPGGVDEYTEAAIDGTPTADPRTDPTAVDGSVRTNDRAVALSQAIGYSLDVQIDDYAIVEVRGLGGLVDAVGGVTIEVTGSVDPARIELDGPLAAEYVASRTGESADDRITRQREVLTALGEQVSASDMIGGFGAAADVLDDSLRTSMSTDEFATLIEVVGDVGAVEESVDLSPPLVLPEAPDYELIRQVVDEVQRSVVHGSAGDSTD